MREGKRKNDELRKIEIIPQWVENPYGSALIIWGKNKILCTASVEEAVPQWLKGKGEGWITAEYSILPGAGAQRIQREATRGRVSGRTIEIQRIIGRALRACCNLSALGERTIWIDCDVLQADGGTRVASITGSYIALFLAIRRLLKEGIIKKNPIKKMVAGVSVGILKGEKIIDLDYKEDSEAEVDMNFVLTDQNEFIEFQATGEKGSFTLKDITEFSKMAMKAVKKIFKIQKKIIKNISL